MIFVKANTIIKIFSSYHKPSILIDWKLCIIYVWFFRN